MKAFGDAFKKYEQKMRQFVKKSQEDYESELRAIDYSISSREYINDKAMWEYDWKKAEESLHSAKQRKEEWIKKRPRPQVKELEQYFYRVGGELDIVTPLKFTSLPLEDREIESIKSSCIKEFDDATKRRLEDIRELVEFCELLQQPENQIRVRSGQVIEKESNLRTEQDMVNEVARVLVGLPKYTAYAKILHEERGSQKVWKGKIQTLKLEAKGEYPLILAKARHGLITSNSLPYLKTRVEIGREIRERQERWQGQAADEAPASYSEGKEKAPPRPNVAGSDEPPPTQYG